jgi:hypothetical protein
VAALVVAVVILVVAAVVAADIWKEQKRFLPLLHWLSRLVLAARAVERVLVVMGLIQLLALRLLLAAVVVVVV